MKREKEKKQTKNISKYFEVKAKRRCTKYTMYTFNFAMELNRKDAKELVKVVPSFVNVSFVFSYLQNEIGALATHFSSFVR